MWHNICFSGNTRVLSIQSSCDEMGKYIPELDEVARKQLQQDEVFFHYGGYSISEQKHNGVVRWFIAGSTDERITTLQRLKRKTLEATGEDFIKYYKRWYALREQMAQSAEGYTPFEQVGAKPKPVDTGKGISIPKFSLRGLLSKITLPHFFKRKK